jgi:hypothetical protein
VRNTRASSVIKISKATIQKKDEHCLIKFGIARHSRSRL